MIDNFDKILNEEIKNIDDKSKLVSKAKKAYRDYLRSCNDVLQALTKEIKEVEREKYGTPALSMNIENGTLSISWKFKKIVRCSMNLSTAQWVCETTGGRKFISDNGNNFDLDGNLNVVAKAIVDAFVRHYKSLGDDK